MAEQAKIASQARSKDSGGTWTSFERSDGLLRAFGGADDDMDQPLAPPARPPAMQTMKELLTGVQDSFGSFASTGFSFGPDNIFITPLPPGCTDAAVKMECARHGAVTSVVIQTDGTSAYVSFASADMATTAWKRMHGKTGILGAIEPLEVKLTSVLPDQIRLAMQLPAGQSGGEKRDENELPEYLRQDRKMQPPKRSRSWRRTKSRSRGRKKSPKRGGGGAVKKKGRSRSLVLLRFGGSTGAGATATLRRASTFVLLVVPALFAGGR